MTTEIPYFQPGPALHLPLGPFGQVVGRQGLKQPQLVFERGLNVELDQKRFNHMQLGSGDEQRLPQAIRLGVGEKRVSGHGSPSQEQRV